MTRTTLSVVRWLVLFLVMGGVIFAGGHKDHGVRAKKWNALGGRSSSHLLVDQIYYDTAKTVSVKRAVPQIEYIESKLSSQLDFGEADPRVEQVRRFFEKHRSPAAKHAAFFVRVADENHLDWRLLPTLALIESGGGKAMIRNSNNIFGWASGKAKFKSVEEAIRVVGTSLTKGPYANKTTAQKLRVYNCHKRYPPYAMRVMKMVSASA